MPRRDPHLVRGPESLRPPLPLGEDQFRPRNWELSAMNMVFVLRAKKSWYFSLFGWVNEYWRLIS